MVKNRLVYLLSLLFLCVACKSNPIGFDEKRMGDVESFGRHFWMLLDFYTNIYMNNPSDAYDVIRFIEGMDEDMQILYENQKDYLIENNDKLIFVSDTCLKVYYKQIREERLVIGMPFGDPCYYYKAPYRHTMNFFDINGDYVNSYSLYDEFRSEANALSTYYKPFFAIDMSGDFIYTVFEYYLQSNTFRDVCADSLIDIGNYPYYMEIANILNDIGTPHGYGKVIFACNKAKSNS